MGLFGGKEIYVSSSVYNLAGDEINRPNFLKSSLFSAVMNPYNAYIGETIVGNYLTGPGIMQRGFFNWAVREDIAGLPTLSVRNTLVLDPAVVSSYIPLPGSPAGLVTRVQSAELTDGDFTYWADQYMAVNYPAQYGTAWVADYNETLNEITIQFAGGSTVAFNPVGFSKDEQYVVANYYQTIPADVGSLVVGTKTIGVTSPPSISGYSLDDSTNTGSVGHTLNQTKRVVKEYSDGSPTSDVTTYPTLTPSFNTILNTYGRVDYLGSDGVKQETTSREKWYYRWERRHVVYDSQVVVVVNDMGGGETETVTTTTSGDFLEPFYDWQEDYQDSLLEAVIGGMQVWIYQIGTGIPVLDAFTSEIAPGGTPEYYPFIPIRLDNKSIKHADFTALYAESKTAYRRAVGGPTGRERLVELVNEVQDNPDIGDIDYSYLQWGVSINVIEPACRLYLYEFFKNLIPFQNSSLSDITTFKASVTAYNAALATINNWTVAQGNPASTQYGDPKPTVPKLSEPKTSTVRLRSNHPDLGGFDNRYTWITVAETNHTGIGKPGALEGDVWFTHGENFTWSVKKGYAGQIFNSTTNVDRSIKQTYLWKQTGVNTYSKLTIWGMVHHNYIYGGKSVKTSLKAAIDDIEASVFIVPLHAPTVKSLGIKNFTQMATANTWITFNSYEVVKKKWYETFLGMLLIIIAIVVISALISPGAVGAASGAFGTNAAVGAGFGLTGTASIVAGAVTNAIAAIVIAQAISYGAVAIFGEKWGAIIGAIVGFAVSFGMASGFSSFNLQTLMQPQTLLKFSSALANGYQGFVQAEIGEINEQMVKEQGTFEKAMKDLENLMRSHGLINDLLFDPLSLTDTTKGNESNNQGSYVPESLDEFINRSTMTGADIVDITLSMVSDYSELQMTLPK